MRRKCWLKMLFSQKRFELIQTSDNTNILFSYFAFIEHRNEMFHQTSLSYNKSNCKREQICIKWQHHKQISNVKFKKLKKQQRRTFPLARLQCSCNWMARNKQKNTHTHIYDRNHVHYSTVSVCMCVVNFTPLKICVK